jgi:hypothetical protein
MSDLPRKNATCSNDSHYVILYIATTINIQHFINPSESAFSIYEKSSKSRYSELLELTNLIIATIYDKIDI